MTATLRPQYCLWQLVWIPPILLFVKVHLYQHDQSRAGRQCRASRRRRSWTSWACAAVTPASSSSRTARSQRRMCLGRCLPLTPLVASNVALEACKVLEEKVRLEKPAFKRAWCSLLAATAAQCLLPLQMK